MPNLLLVSATALEIEPTLEFLKFFQEDAGIYSNENLKIQILITGVGMVNTAFKLGQLSSNQFDLVINAGIAGSFGSNKVGSVVNVTEDSFVELGAEDDLDFLSIDELKLGSQRVTLISQYSSPVVEELSVVSGITVNTVHGNLNSISKIKNRHINSDIESMEGAAFILAANASNWRALQLRAVSNLVEKRNRENWNMPLAVGNLNQILIRIIKELQL